MGVSLRNLRNKLSLKEFLACWWRGNWGESAKSTESGVAEKALPFVREREFAVRSQRCLKSCSRLSKFTLV